VRRSACADIAVQQERGFQRLRQRRRNQPVISNCEINVPATDPVYASAAAKRRPELQEKKSITRTRFLRGTPPGIDRL